jgi:hypothetical protein
MKSVISRYHKPIEVKSVSNGQQAIYRFPNNYGASVVNHSYSYGGLELAVIKFEGDYFAICYDTPITRDVVGYLEEESMEKLLNSIKAL